MVYIYNGILLGHKKEWNNAICSNMDGTKDDHTKWSKSGKDKYHLYVKSKKWYKWTSLQNRKRHKLCTQIYGYQRGKIGGIN